MPEFRRAFDCEKLAAWDRANPGNAVRALFDRWALPGEATDAARPLRVGIRDGYLNLYAKGQSVAKLSIGGGRPSIDVHDAYVSGRRAGEQGNAGQRYVTFAADALADPATTALLAGWVATAQTYASAEKRFVDDLIAVNAGVIDLEMGLPAGDEAGGDRVAPRMDLVVARVEGGTPGIAFSEAKCANNPELRISGDAAPKVLGQLQKYVDWMTVERAAQVRRAYARTARALLDLQALFRPDATSPCLPIWQLIAGTEAATVIVRPGVVIGNYWPEGSTEGIASERMAQAAASFTRNGHRGKIVAAGVTLHEVADPSGAALPLLTPA